MDLKLFLDPLDEDFTPEKQSSSVIQKSLSVYQETLPDIEGMDMAILGIPDQRAEGGSINREPALRIRRKFYGFSETSGRNRIVDLGDLRSGPTAEDTVLRLGEVVHHLLEHNVLPILIGGTQDMMLAQYRAYEGLDKLITVLNIDSWIDLRDEAKPTKSYLNPIFRHDPNFLFNYVHLGYQSYLVSEDDLAMMERLSFEVYRLGQFRDDFKQIEPVIREADMAGFDLSSIQSIYCPGTSQPNVFGFTGEEACQMAWYAGHNDKLSSFGLYNYTGDGDDRSEMVIATMIWYFIDGYYHRKGDSQFMSNDYLVYEVSLGGEPDTIRFYKSKLSEKWWMEVPDESSDSIFLRNRMVPCSYEDYETAQAGEVPHRWINAYTKLS